MAEPEWTKGPWFSNEDEEYAGDATRFVLVVDGKEDAIARVMAYGRRSGARSKAETAANARLISAVHEMYEALEFVFDHIADKERGPRDLYPAFGLNASRALVLCRGALAKARGEDVG